jgi:hypothetical protein
LARDLAAILAAGLAAGFVFVFVFNFGMMSAAAGAGSTTAAACNSSLFRGAFLAFRAGAGAAFMAAFGFEPSGRTNAGAARRVACERVVSGRVGAGKGGAESTFGVRVRFGVFGGLARVSISLIPTRLPEARSLPRICVYVTIQHWRRSRFGHITGIYNRGANDQKEGCGCAGRRLLRLFLRTKFDRLMTRLSGILKTAPAQWLQICAIVAIFALFAAPHAAIAADEPGSLTRALGIRTTVPEAPDFVVKSRRPTQDFIPVHTPRAKPDGKPMVKDEVAKQEKSLDSARIRQDRLAGRVSAPVGKSVAADMETKDAKKVAKPVACGLTCPSPGLLPSKSGKEAR